MFRTALRTVAVTSAMALVAAVFVSTAGASTRRGTVQGVTKDKIEVVAIVPDLDQLRAQGIPVSRTTVADYQKRWQGNLDALGKVNGRSFNVTAVGWNPTDPLSNGQACTKATQDNKPFLVLVASGYPVSDWPCITDVNATPLIAGDPAYRLLATDKNLISLGIQSESLGKTAAQTAIKAGLITKTDKIGILSNNFPQVKAVADTLEADLKKQGYNVVQKVEINGLAGNATLNTQQAQAAVPTFQAAGTTVVFLPQSMTAFGSYFADVKKLNTGIRTIVADGQGGTCERGQASRTVPEAEGIHCISFYGTKALPDKSGIAPDTAFEAKCRATFDAFTGLKSVPGAPSGDLTSAKYGKFNEDFQPTECTVANVLVPAVKKAGKNLTWAKVRKNILATTEAPVAYEAGGEGGFGPDKPYLHDKVHVMQLVRASDDTPQDANGKTWNGCPIPRPCWIPVLVDGKDWLPAATVKASGNG